MLSLALSPASGKIPRGSTSGYLRIGAIMPDTRFGSVSRPLNWSMLEHSKRTRRDRCCLQLLPGRRDYFGNRTASRRCRTRLAAPATARSSLLLLPWH
eukprot:6183290-Pleurochrysis_carterae.AAC.4